MDNIITKGKDKFSKDIQTNVVYKFECNDCEKTYIGQSKREALVRIDEHEGGITAYKNKKRKEEEKTVSTQKHPTRISQRLLNKNPDYRKEELHNASVDTYCKEENINNKKPKKYPVVTQHYIDTGHNFNFKEFKILDKEPSYHKRTISERIHIKLHPTAINKIEDTENLFAPYNSIFHKLKKIKS